MNHQSVNNNETHRIKSGKYDDTFDTTSILSTSKIRRLDPQTINHIAAGEVIERPASVAKELIDNALDAGASIIHIVIEHGGIRFLSCTDDGFGMSPEDARMALESHATSKLNTIHDLTSLSTGCVIIHGSFLIRASRADRQSAWLSRRSNEHGPRNAAK